ncbi:MAG: TRAP transporter permease [Rickettsiales bacterium]|nr:TRAP transporter permease [Rickettsiales bacterium]
MSQSDASAELLLEQDGGARDPKGLASWLLLWVAVIWSLFQLWVASPLVYDPFFYKTLGIPVLNSNQYRSWHLGFALLLAFLAYPASKRSPRNYVPALDWVFAILGTGAAMYLFVFYQELANRSGLPNQWDLISACIGGVLLLEATRRTLGWPLVILAGVFLTYIFAGPHMPDLISHKGQSFTKVASHMWLTTEGVFGIALGVSADFVFLFVLFGALLDKAGAGNYFIKSAFALLGHLRGGPAKAAVLASGFTGLISGSSIANVVTTGTFTIPLMKRVGFSAEKAGAVEVAGSVNGQIMPPVMGAAAFLMIEYVNIPYIEVIRHAFLPAIISYIALLYIVHLEALKSGIPPLPRLHNPSMKERLIGWGITISSLVILCGVIYYALNFIKEMAGDNAIFVIAALVFGSYAFLLKLTTTYPELELDNPDDPKVVLPDIKPTLMSGLHFLLPLVVLIWSLMIERLSPGLSAFYASVMMVFILLTQRPLIAFFRKTENYGTAIKGGLADLRDGLEMGARNMVGIAIATAAAGIIVGAVTLTGVANIMPEIVDSLAGDSLIMVLILTAIICLILGMGLPTTANYIVVSSIMVGVIQTLGAKHGLVVPLIGIHLFVFYFGIMADVTPPVGLASFAAAAVSGGDPIKTGLQAFWYSIRTAILPFIFLFNTDILLIGVESIGHGIWVFFYATTAILLLTAVLQGYFIIRSKLWESLALLLVSITLFRPGMWIDMISPPYGYVEPNTIEQAITELPADAELRIKIKGEDAIGESVEHFVMLPMGAQTATGQERLAQQGITMRYEDSAAIVDSTTFMSPAEKAGFFMDNQILEVGIPQAQPRREWPYIPAFLLLGLITWIQMKRSNKHA